MNQDALLKVLYEEALARCRYEVYAKKAHLEGLHYIGKIFEETGRNELSHVTELMNLLKQVDSTKNNLKQAVMNEKKESGEIYPGLQEEAVVENELDTARFFQQLAKIESRHQERFEALLNLIENDMVYKRSEPIKWKCRVCGYIHEGTEPPKKCPGCQHDMSCYEPSDFSI